MKDFGKRLSLELKMDAGGVTTVVLMDGVRFDYLTYFINEDLGWGYQIYSNENCETFRRNYGFKTMMDARNKAIEEIHKMESEK